VKTCRSKSDSDYVVNVNENNLYVGSPYCLTEMYTGRVACCPLLSHGEYADGTDGQKDRRQTVILRFPLDMDSITTELIMCIAND